MRAFAVVCTVFSLTIGYSLPKEIPIQTEMMSVTTRAGEVVGRISEVSMHETERKLSVWTFYGIPYARPPVGQLRFKPPVEPEPWVGQRTAFDQPNSCVQAFPNDKISEDCLYLNVIVPVPVPEKAAVMVWIYGGAYSGGSVSSYDYRLFAAKQNVILVEMNYRVSSLGFMYLGTEDCPGNAALWDQQLAMKWVHENIDRFGGDPDKVTIFGHSAGSASVGHQLLNPVSQKYFKRAMMQSGSPYGAWAADSKTLALRKTLDVAKAVGCNDTRTDSLISCLRNIDAVKLVDTSARVAGVVSKFHAPVFDNIFVFDDRLSTINSLREKQVLIGFTSNDGGFLVRTLLDMAKIDPKEIFERSVKQYVGETNVNLVEITPQLLKSIKYYYQDHCDEIKDYIEEVTSTRLMTDYFFTCPTSRLADALVAKGVSTFLYQFHHRALTANQPTWIEADHGAELSFLMGNTETSAWRAGIQPIEYELSERIMNYWGSFAKQGNPNFEALCLSGVSGNKQPHDLDKGNSTSKIIETWARYTTKEKWRLDINLDSSLQAPGEVQEDQCAFWRHDFPILAKGRT